MSRYYGLGESLLNGRMALIPTALNTKNLNPEPYSIAKTPKPKLRTDPRGFEKGSISLGFRVRLKAQRFEV